VSNRPPRLWVFYHYLYPDNVVSAVQMDLLCHAFVERGWEVSGFASNRGCRDEALTYPAREKHLGVDLHRLWRPRFRQSSTAGRLLNAAWMIARWSLLASRRARPDAILIGTDPILSVTTAIPWRLLRPQTRIVHWCFDLYPEAAYADHLLQADGGVARFLAWLLRHAYKACDAIVDIGPCMRDRLTRYGSPASRETIPPWALEEPDRPLPGATLERERVAGSARLSLLYSGNFGRGHTYEDFLALAKALRDADAALTFSVRGNRETELHEAVAALPSGSSCPVHFVPFASPDSLLDRLAAPDVHLLSLDPAWTGLVVPSKFFGAIAVGRPVLFSGSEDSSIARWIREFKLGWVVHEHNAEEVAGDLIAYANDPERIRTMQQRCFETYRQHFSRAASTRRMCELVEALLAKRGE